MFPTIPTDRTPAQWRNESTQKPPKQAVYVSESSAADILKNAHSQTATIWTGDFHNAKQVLAAMKKRIRRPSEHTKKPPADIQTAFHTHRMKQAQQSRILNMLCVEVLPNFQLDNPRAPDICNALTDVYGSPNKHPFLLPLNQLLGFLGAHEWHKKGVCIPQLDGKIHVPFGVFSPLRGEYLDLLAQAPIPPHTESAFDIGTGSGVIAAVLARRGIPHISATDNNPKAIACATANIARLGLDKQVGIQNTDLFPQGCADLIVCNPPWLPAKPTSAIETALYDPDSAMLNAFLNGAAGHLNPDGEIWLIISDLAEHLNLREKDFLQHCFQKASLKVAGILKTKPTHRKASDPSDPLALARSKETTFLYRLKPASPL